LTVLVPFALGLIINQLRPTFAARASPLAGKAGMLLLAVASVPILVKMWPAMMSLIGDGTLLAIVAFVAVGLAVGHLLGGPDPADRVVLALATPMRHPGVALVVASVTAAGTKAVAPALLPYLLVGTIASIPYVRWRRRIAAARDAAHTRWRMADTSDQPTARFVVDVTSDSHFGWIRTRLAVERTLMAYLRTGVALIGFGFTIVQFFQRLGGMEGVAPASRPHAAHDLGLALIGAGVLSLLISAWQYWRLVRYLWS